jgi:formylglycine-generating enzyme required for sulfatase activity
MREQDIHFDPLQDRVIDGKLFPLLATATSGLKVHFTVVSGPAQVVGSQLMLTGPGEVVIRATQPGDATHAAATPVEHSFKALAPSSEQTETANSAETASAPEPSPTPASSSTPESAPSEKTVEAPPQNSAATPALPAAASDLVPKALINAANGQTGPAAPHQLPANLTLTLPGNVQMIFVRVPAGQALLGSKPDETGHQPDETQHPFSEPRGFLMSATEVTQAQYEALTGQRPSYFRSDWQSRPVEQIRWSDVAQDTNGFFAHLNQLLQSSGHADFSAALPTDDQWEYACRAGTQTAYNNRTGLSFPIDESNIREIATFNATETSAVATHSPNAWGLYDMHGNVAEWTREGSLRGGSFRDSPAFIRSASKQLGKASTTDLDREAGFRVVLLLGSPGLDTR